jgi:hypothetical protein
MRRRFVLSVTLLIIFISAALAQDSQVIFLCRHSSMCEPPWLPTASSATCGRWSLAAGKDTQTDCSINGQYLGHT